MSKYNVVLITVDSWNRNFVGCFNDKAREENLTPHLDKFAEKCVVFPSAFSASVKTSVSVLSILSGCCPCKYGDWYSSGISKNRIIISEYLKSNGYSTYGFTSNPCTSSLRNYNKGFDLFRDDNIFKNIKGNKLKILLAIKTLLKNPYSPADEINTQVFRYVNRNTPPYFVNIHYMDLHGPYISKNGGQFINRISAGKLWNKALVYPKKITFAEKEKMIDVYKEQTKFLDNQLGELLREMDDDKTIIIITGDHADVFGMRGYYGHPYIFYNEMINVPLLIKLPSDMNIKNRICEHPVSLMDLVPTIVDILDIKTENKFDGNSLLPLIDGNGDKYHTKYIISEVSRKHASIIKGEWKLIANFGESSFELYNWKEDYKEKINLINERADIRQELEVVMKDHMRRNQPSK